MGVDILSQRLQNPIYIRVSHFNPVCSHGHLRTIFDNDNEKVSMLSYNVSKNVENFSKKLNCDNFLGIHEGATQRRI